MLILKLERWLTLNGAFVGKKGEADVGETASSVSPSTLLAAHHRPGHLRPEGESHWVPWCTFRQGLSLNHGQFPARWVRLDPLACVLALSQKAEEPRLVLTHSTSFSPANTQ